MSQLPSCNRTPTSMLMSLVMKNLKESGILIFTCHLTMKVINRRLREVSFLKLKRSESIAHYMLKLFCYEQDVRREIMSIYCIYFDVFLGTHMVGQDRRVSSCFYFYIQSLHIPALFI